jgi:16S rRNA (cytosine1402-N4)-methyltransferase
MKSRVKHTSDQVAADVVPNNYHISVLLKESIEALAIKPDGIYVDCTFGGGGHSKELLKHLGKEGKLFVFDQDADAVSNLPNDTRVIFIHQNFRHLSRFLRLHGCTEVDGILADLGVSSHQFDEASRGFSIRFDAPLDMRMDVRQGTTAADLLNQLSEQELQQVFQTYGEVTNARTLARTIVEKRKSAPLKTIEQFKHAIHEVVKGNPQQYLAKVFQSLRMKVNDELEALQEMLTQAAMLLKPEGRLAVITFHSLEDRVVKQFFKTGCPDVTEVNEIYGIRAKNLLNPVNKKPISASDEEIKKNSRSRSAKLRISEKIKN